MRVCLHLVMHVLFLYWAHVSMSPLQFLSDRSVVDSRAWVSSWPSHQALSVGSMECAGMWPQTGVKVLLKDRYPSPPFSPSSSLSIVLPAPTLSSVPLLCLKNECQETTLLSSLCTGEKEVDTLGKGCFDIRTTVQAFPFIFFLLAIFCLMDCVWIQSASNAEYSHSSADDLSECFSFPELIHSIYLSKELDRHLSGLGNKLLDRTRKKKTSSVSILHPPSTYHPLSLIQILIVS